MSLTDPVTNDWSRVGSPAFGGVFESAHLLLGLKSESPEKGPIQIPHPPCRNLPWGSWHLRSLLQASTAPWNGSMGVRSVLVPPSGGDCTPLQVHSPGSRRHASCDQLHECPPRKP